VISGSKEKNFLELILVLTQLQQQLTFYSCLSKYKGCKVKYVSACHQVIGLTIGQNEVVN
jgi:hypothetical protein